MTRRTHGSRESRVLGCAKADAGQVPKAPQVFTGRPMIYGPFAATGGSGACEAPTLPPVETTSAFGPGAFLSGAA